VKRTRRAALALALGVAVASASWAQPEPAAAGAETALDGFHAALAAGDGDAALAKLDPDVVIFEAGGAELSRDEYASHHLADDMDFLAVTTTERVDRRSGASGDVVWVLTRTKTTGTYEGREIAVRGTETALLTRGPEGWRIVHLHWSSHRTQ